MVRLVRTIAIVGVCGLSLIGCSTFERAIGRPPRVFVSNQKDGSVSVLEGNPAQQTKVIPVGVTLGGLAARAAPALLAVADAGGRRIAFIDPATAEIVRTVALRAVP